MVATGWPYENGKHSEVIDLLDPDAICDPLPDYPIQVQRAIGGLIHDRLPIVCGGWNGTFGNAGYNMECYDAVSNEYLLELDQPRWVIIPKYNLCSKVSL